MMAHILITPPACSLCTTHRSPRHNVLRSVYLLFELLLGEINLFLGNSHEHSIIPFFSMRAARTLLFCMIKSSRHHRAWQERHLREKSIIKMSLLHDLFAPAIKCDMHGK